MGTTEDKSFSPPKIILFPNKKEVVVIFETVLLVTLFTVGLSMVLVSNVTTDTHQQFVFLADSFLHGTTSFREIPGSFTDIASFNGKLYWSAGPFPATLLMPFVFIFGTKMMQGYLQFLLVILNIFLIYRMALILGIQRKINAWWISFASAFGSMYISTALFSSSWRFAQIVATSLLLLALYEYFGKKRFLLIGILIAAAFATRAHLILGSVFFILAIMTSALPWRERIKNLLSLVTPIVLMGLLLLCYNYARFSNPFESGYNYGPWNSASPISEQNGRYTTWQLGFEYGKGKLFSFRYLPSNLYYYFLHGPEATLLSPDSYIIVPPYFKKAPTPSVGSELNNILISAPLFLFVLLASTRMRLVRYSLITAMVIFIPILFFISPAQRYFLDVMPFLLIPLVIALKDKMTPLIKTLIVVSLLINLLLIR